MPITLLFSRNRQDDQSVRFLDNPIEGASLMVDALSFASAYRRAVGWLYPIRQASELDYERGEGKLILFGKNRVTFDDFPSPYFLEFYPRYGVSNYVLSFYTGVWGEGVSSGWVDIPGGGWSVNYFPEEYVIKNRFGGDGGPVYELDSLVVETFVLGDAVFIKKADLTIQEWRPYRSGGGSISTSAYEIAKASPEAVILS